MLTVAVASILSSACEGQEPHDGAPSKASANRLTAKPPPPAAPVKVELREQAMGTLVHLVAYSSAKTNERTVRSAFRAAMAEIERLEKLMSSWRADSEISKINQGAGQFVAVSAETFEVIERSIWAGNLSSGVFDITFQVMSDVWKFGDAAENPPRVPTVAEVERRRRLIDYRKLEIVPDGRLVKLPKDMTIDLGGIAKGYIVDRAAAVLRQAGVSAFLVQAGGDLYGHGSKPDGAPWTSGIQDPRGPHGSYFARIELTDRAFSTAGDYARSYVVGAKRYHHIIDPRTGFPATASRSVTIWAPDALTADAVDDAVFILGPKRGLELVESLPGTGAVIVDGTNKVWISRRLEGKIQMLKPPTDGL